MSTPTLQLDDEFDPSLKTVLNPEPEPPFQQPDEPLPVGTVMSLGLENHQEPLSMHKLSDVEVQRFEESAQAVSSPWQVENQGGLASPAVYAGIFRAPSRSESAQSSRPAMALALLILTVSLWLGKNYFVQQDLPGMTIWSLITGDLPLPGADHRPKTPVNKVTEPQKPQSAAIKSEPRPIVFAGETIKQPYGRLQNQVEPRVPMREGVYSRREELALRNKLTKSTYYYTRYEALQNIVAHRKGSYEGLLRTALATGRFWMRMEAVTGLADLGYRVQPQDVEQALSGAGPSLRARYFERFIQGPCSAACRFIAREAMKNLNGEGRLHVLKILSYDTTPIDEHYFVAATFDQDPKVRAFAAEWLLRYPVDETTWWEIYHEMKNDGEFS